MASRGIEGEKLDAQTSSHWMRMAWRGVASEQASWRGVASEWASWRGVASERASWHQMVVWGKLRSRESLGGGTELCTKGSMQHFTCLLGNIEGKKLR